MKFITITAALAACLLGPSAAFAVPADQHQPDLRSAATSGSLGAAPSTGGHYVGSTFVLNTPAQAPATAGVDLRSPDARDASLPARVAPTPVAANNGSDSSGFDWGDAALGAATMLGLGLVSLGAFLVLGTSRRHRTTI